MHAIATTDNSVSGSSRHNERSYYVQTKCTFCGLNIHSVEKCFKKIRKEKKTLVLLVFHLTKIRIVQLGNALDADLKII